jgi:CheY-like chemotaxis protein
MDRDPKIIRALIVEDNSSDAFLLKKALTKARQAEFEITTVERLDDAITALNDNDFDLVLTDLNLPDSVGVETISKLVQNCRGLPIIALTGWDDPDLGSRLVAEGASCYWVKDRIKGPDLLEAIFQCIKGDAMRD